MIRLNASTLGMDRRRPDGARIQADLHTGVASVGGRRRIRRLGINSAVRTMHRTSLWDGEVRIAGLALLLILLSALGDWFVLRPVARRGKAGNNVARRSAS